jgi:hypothetical protein
MCALFLCLEDYTQHLPAQPANSGVMKRGDIEKCAKAQSTALKIKKIEGTRVCRDNIYLQRFRRR